MRLFLFIFVLFMVASRSYANQPLNDDENSSLIPIQNFVSHSLIRMPSLNLDGSRLLFGRRNGANDEIAIGTIQPSGFKQVFQIDVPEDVYAYRANWINNERLLIQYIRYEGALPLLLENPAVEIFAINFDGSDNLPLWSEKAEPTQKRRSRRGNRTKVTKAVYFQIVHLLQNEPDYILLSRIEETPNRRSSDEKDVVTDIFKFNIRTAEMELVTPEHNVEDAKMYAWLPDHNGDIRLGYGEDDDENPVMLIRLNSQSEWIRLDNNELFESGKFYPLQFGVEDDELYVSSSHATGRSAIYRFSISRGELAGKIFTNPNVSAMSINYSFNKGKIVSVNHYEDVFGRTVMDNDFDTMLTNIDEATGANGSFSLGSTSLDENRMVVWVGDERSPGSVWFYDGQLNEAIEIGAANPSINPSEMATTVPVKYSARDGLDIPAYLTLPLNYEAGKPLPAIVMPHGGPHVRDYKEWDSWVQFLANRGYVVLQPNFRGSRGFGSRFLALGFGEWGDDMQQDVADGAKWLVRSGYSSFDQICIVGGSYGGYAALMGIIQDPDRFQCAVSWAPVTDLKLILKQDGYYNKEYGHYWRVTGGKDTKELKEISPRFQAKGIARPLLLMHGTQDKVVYIEQSRLLVKEMNRAKIDFKYIEIEGLGHNLETEEAATQFLQELENFLAEHNPTNQLTQIEP